MHFYELNDNLSSSSGEHANLPFHVREEFLKSTKGPILVFCRFHSASLENKFALKNSRSAEIPLRRILTTWRVTHASHEVSLHLDTTPVICASPSTSTPRWGVFDLRTCRTRGALWITARQQRSLLKSNTPTTDHVP